MELINIYRAFHPKATDYTFFSNSYGIFSRIEHMLGHKVSFGSFNKIEILSTIFSDHNTMKLEILLSCLSFFFFLIARNSLWLYILLRGYIIYDELPNLSSRSTQSDVSYYLTLFCFNIVIPLNILFCHILLKASLWLTLVCSRVFFAISIFSHMCHGIYILLVRGSKSL